jgi:hypothetical protein
MDDYVCDCNINIRRTSFSSINLEKIGALGAGVVVDDVVTGVTEEPVDATSPTGVDTTAVAMAQ